MHRQTEVRFIKATLRCGKRPLLHSTILKLEFTIMDRCGDTNIHFIAPNAGTFLLLGLLRDLVSLMSSPEMLKFRQKLTPHRLSSALVTSKKC